MQHCDDTPSLCSSPAHPCSKRTPHTVERLSEFLPYSTMHTCARARARALTHTHTHLRAPRSAAPPHRQAHTGRRGARLRSAGTRRRTRAAGCGLACAVLLPGPAYTAPNLTALLHPTPSHGPHHTTLETATARRRTAPTRDQCGQHAPIHLPALVHSGRRLCRRPRLFGRPRLGRLSFLLLGGLGGSLVLGLLGQLQEQAQAGQRQQRAAARSAAGTAASTAERSAFAATAAGTATPARHCHPVRSYCRL